MNWFFLHMKRFITILFFLCNLQMLSAQDHSHSHENFHVGLGVTEAYSTGHNEFNPGIHLHLMKSIGHANFWKVGLGYEFLNGDEKHHSFYLPLAMQLFEGFTLSVAPGVVMAKEDGVNESLLSGHVEGLYEFELGPLHLGPLIGFGFNRHESHIGLGIHAGFGF